ncbi:MAG: SecE/Sec61-gamma subunit of protein translocation complex [Clostridia bacterium]|jgi:preprotein translocase subunit SecE|nr:SecE/Sec61-gamma subunit of protein translocation complex [Clostridia bacterium]
MTNSFLKGIKAELKKVVWPTKKQLINNTVMVILLVLALAAIVLTFDMVVEFLDLKFWDLIKNKIG